MKDSLVIKSSPYGLTLYLNREIPFEDLVREVCIKFAGAKTFFGSATLALSFEGRELTTEEAAVLVEAVELNSDLRISMVLENDETKNREEKKKIDRIYYENTLEHAKIIRGSIKSGQEVSFDTSVVILGNVKPRAKVMAKGNIIIFGGGIPIKVGDTIIGGLGVSGGTGEEDHSLAEYGLSRLAEALQ